MNQPQQTQKSRIKKNLYLNPEQIHLKVRMIPPQRKVSLKDDQYFQKVKSVYTNKKVNNSPAQVHQSSRQNIKMTQQQSRYKLYNQRAQSHTQNHSKNMKQVLIHSQTQQLKIKQGKKNSPSLISHNFHNKLQKQIKYKTLEQNYQMTKRLNQIQQRKNRYLKIKQKCIQFQKSHKLTHQTSINNQRKLKHVQMQQDNDKFVDRLMARVMHKRTVKPILNQRSLKSIRLQDSRLKLAHAQNRSFLLPPMIFQLNKQKDQK